MKALVATVYGQPPSTLEVTDACAGTAGLRHEVS